MSICLSHAFNARQAGPFRTTQGSTPSRTYKASRPRLSMISPLSPTSRPRLSLTLTSFHCLLLNCPTSPSRSQTAPPFPTSRPQKERPRLTSSAKSRSRAGVPQLRRHKRPSEGRRRIRVPCTLGTCGGKVAYRDLAKHIGDCHKQVCIHFLMFIHTCNDFA